MKLVDHTLGILAVTPEGAAKAYRDLMQAFFRRHGPYVNLPIHMFTQPLLAHVESFGDEQRWTALVREGLRALKDAGARTVWIPANSTHLVLGAVQDVGIEIVDMVGLCVAKLLASQTRALVLGTSVSVSDRLYFRNPALRDHCVRPDSIDQEHLDAIILEELLFGLIEAESRAFVLGLIQKHRDLSDIQSVFLACTELPCFFDQQSIEMPVDDSVQVAIDHIVQQFDSSTYEGAG